MRTRRIEDEVNDLKFMLKGVTELSEIKDILDDFLLDSHGVIPEDEESYAFYISLYKQYGLRKLMEDLGL